MIVRKTPQSTAPWLWCVRRLATAVKMIVAIDVPSARCNTSPGGNCGCAANIMVSAGTMTRPPPMPSRPAKKPENAPSAR